jgi:hypothetical protein
VPSAASESAGGSETHDRQASQQAAVIQGETRFSDDGLRELSTGASALRLVQKGEAERES